MSSIAEGISVKRTLLFAALLWHLFDVTPPAIAQSSNLIEAFEKFKSLYAQGRFAAAEPYVRKALKLGRDEYGADHQGYGEADPLFNRSLNILENSVKPNQLQLAEIHNNLAILYEKQGEYFKAQNSYIRSYKIDSKYSGPNHPRVATAINNLAELYRARRLYGEAEPLYKRSLAIREKSYGPNHIIVAATISNLASLYLATGRHDKAEPLYNRALAIHKKSPVANNPDLAKSHENMSMFFRTVGKPGQSLDHIRRAIGIRRARAVQIGGGKSASHQGEQKLNRSSFMLHVLDTIAHSKIDATNRNSLIAEGFESSQLASTTRAAMAVSNMAARFSTGNSRLAQLIRDRQDAAARWRKLDKALLRTAGEHPHRRDRVLEATWRQNQLKTAKVIRKIDVRLNKSFPQYAELTSPNPVPIADTQRLLENDEALLSILTLVDRSFVFVVRRGQIHGLEIKTSEKEINAAVTTLRKSLDPEEDINTVADIPRFDTDTAFQLYQKLFHPIEPMLTGVRHLFVVPDGGLQSLPLGVLVTRKPEKEFTDNSEYRQVAWLARKYALTTLPSVSALRALRKFAKPTRASKPFLGIGDPQLDGKTGSARGVKISSLYSLRGIADVDALREFPSLPDTADELKMLAKTLGTDQSTLILGTEATETRIKKAPLHDYKVLTFATHGLVAGDLDGLSEPALVLTPPAKGTVVDDGLLTASEIARLKLDADWVILSACNTAAADGAPGAEGLSGLATAFFYAGTRTLLVSHWPVVSEVAVKITTRMLAEVTKNGVRRSEAHRRSILSILDDKTRPDFAHPIFWAPFTVVGEGGNPKY